MRGKDLVLFALFKHRSSTRQALVAHQAPCANAPETLTAKVQSDLNSMCAAQKCQAHRHSTQLDTRAVHDRSAALKCLQTSPTLCTTCLVDCQQHTLMYNIFHPWLARSSSSLTDVATSDCIGDAAIGSSAVPSMARIARTTSGLQEPRWPDMCSSTWLQKLAISTNTRQRRTRIRTRKGSRKRDCP
jgi:hypothetical protein